MRRNVIRSVKGIELKVSNNKRYLVNQYEEPFFYLGDVAWTLFKRLNHEEVDEYFKNRISKGFTVIQAYVLRGLEVPNLYGDLTLVEKDPAKPNEAFFKNVDFVVNRANELGLVMSLVTTWGEHVRQVTSKTNEQVFDISNAFEFGRFLGARYQNNAVIWLLGGDREPLDIKVWTAMAKGLKDGSKNKQLVSYHGPGPRPDLTGYSSSFWFHNEDWLDFNMIQSGHRWATPSYDFITHDYALKPIKPTIDMESRFENHPTREGKRIDAHQVREAAYGDVLAGAAGHGYGCNDIWQFYDEETKKPFGNDNSYPFDICSANTNWHKVYGF